MINPLDIWIIVILGILTLILAIVAIFIALIAFKLLEASGTPIIPKSEKIMDDSVVALTPEHEAEIKNTLTGEKTF